MLFSGSEKSSSPSLAFYILRNDFVDMATLFLKKITIA
jgi:hypothetical protein